MLRGNDVLTNGKRGRVLVILAGLVGVLGLGAAGRARAAVDGLQGGGTSQAGMLLPAVQGVRESGVSDDDPMGLSPPVTQVVEESLFVIGDPDVLTYLPLFPEAESDQLQRGEFDMPIGEFAAWCEEDRDGDGLNDGIFTADDVGGMTCCFIDYGCLTCPADEDCYMECSSPECEEAMAGPRELAELAGPGDGDSGSDGQVILIERIEPTLEDYMNACEQEGGEFEVHEDGVGWTCCIADFGCWECSPDTGCEVTCFSQQCEDMLADPDGGDGQGDAGEGGPVIIPVGLGADLVDDSGGGPLPPGDPLTPRATPQLRRGRYGRTSR